MDSRHMTVPSLAEKLMYLLFRTSATRRPFQPIPSSKKGAKSSVRAIQ